MRLAASVAAGSMAVLSVLMAPTGAIAGVCEGKVVNVRPVSQYNHYNGNGFLAVRNGPGGGYSQIGEVYRNDLLEITDKRGNWYYASCQSGRCTNPLWGPSYPEGWVHKNYVRVSGYCPH